MSWCREGTIISRAFNVYCLRAVPRLAPLKSLSRGALGTISLPPFGGNEMVGAIGIEPMTPPV